MTDAENKRNGDALVEATRMGIPGGIADYLSKSSDALGRIPADLLRYWSSLPVNNEYEPIGVRAAQGTNYAIDSGLQALSGGRWGLAPFMAGLGLPTGELQRGIDDFGRRNASSLKILGDAGEVAAGVAPALHTPKPNVSQALMKDEALASRVVPGYNPKAKPQRPFEADYPSGAETDGLGELTRDIEGRRLGGVDASSSGPENGGVRIVGRRLHGGPDEAIPQTIESYDALAEALVGARPERVAPREIGDSAGKLRKLIDPQTGDPYRRIYLSKALDESKTLRTTGHEVGHAIDEIAGQVPVNGLTKELEFVYNALTTGAERTRNLTRPKDLKYTPEEAPREMMAEAIRAYLTDPNYIKTVAPKTAAAIRGAVNNNPRLNKTIQFNQLAPFVASAQLTEEGGEHRDPPPPVIFSLSPDELRRKLSR